MPLFHRRVGRVSHRGEVDFAARRGEGFDQAAAPPPRFRPCGRGGPRNLLGGRCRVDGVPGFVAVVLPRFGSACVEAILVVRPPHRPVSIGSGSSPLSPRSSTRRGSPRSGGIEGHRSKNQRVDSIPIPFCPCPGWKGESQPLGSVSRHEGARRRRGKLERTRAGRGAKRRGEGRGGRRKTCRRADGNERVRIGQPA